MEIYNFLYQKKWNFSQKKKYFKWKKWIYRDNNNELYSLKNNSEYLFQTVEPQIISKENDTSIRNDFQEALLYPIWFIPFNYNNHFTLFIMHTIHQHNSFEQSYVLYFNSLPSFQSDTISHINIIKRISNCIGCRVATSPYNHGDPTEDGILL